MTERGTQESVVLEALEIAAGAGDDSVTGGWLDARTTPSKRKISALRHFARRFVEDLPDDMTVREIREELDV